jgi:hypothetical protein
MSRKSIFTIAITAGSLLLSMPAFAQQGSMGGDQEVAAPASEQVAMPMVAASAALKGTLSADKVAAGSAFEARLANKTQLANGPLLPAGTRLVGTVVRDDTNNNGAPTLALRFETAYLKNGTAVPIKATIVGAFGPEETNDSGWSIRPGDQVPNTWNDGTQRIDQIGVLHGVDLHSSIASPNSGVFVSESNHNVKLDAGSELALAIAARTDTSDATTPASEH